MKLRLQNKLPEILAQPQSAPCPWKLFAAMAVFCISVLYPGKSYLSGVINSFSTKNRASHTITIQGNPQNPSQPRPISNPIKKVDKHHFIKRPVSSVPKTSASFWRKQLLEEKIDLNGIWDFTPEGLPKSTIDVPGHYVWKKKPNDLFDYGDVDRPGKFVDGIEEAVYEKVFTVPASWIGKKIFLRFESVNFLAKFYINNQHIGTHLGGYVPFEFEINPYITFSSTDTLNVEILYHDNRFIDSVERPLCPVGFFGHNWCLGITGKVALISRPSVYIDDVFVKTSVRNSTISTYITVINRDQIQHTVDVLSNVELNGALVKSIGSQQITVNAAETTQVSIEQTWPDATLWSPENPVIYHSVCTLQEIGTEIHEKVTLFGFREFWINGTHFILNGVRKNLRGDNIVIDSEKQYWQYLIADSIDWAAILDSLISLNINVIRMHQEPAPSWMLDLCDIKGMLVISESAIYSYDYVPKHSSIYVNNGVIWQKNWIKRDRNHASIILWAAENEMVVYGNRFYIDQIKQWGDAITQMDNSRPILFEGDKDISGNAQIYSHHYIYGFPNGWPSGSIYEIGSYVHAQKPTCHSEFEWTRGEIPGSEHVKRQSIKTRACRYVGFADIRPYRLDWAWHPNPEFFNIYSGWTPTQEEVDFLSNSLNPVAVFDKTYYENDIYPPVPEYNEGDLASRQIIIFNDDPSETEVQVKWEVLLDEELFDTGDFTENITLGSYTEKTLVFRVPYVPHDKNFYLKLSTWKNGQERFQEKTMFRSISIGIGPPDSVNQINFQRSVNSLTLSWPPVLTNQDGEPTTIDHYTVYRCPDVTFSPAITDSITGITSTSIEENLTGIIGNDQINVFYKIRATDNISLLSEWSSIYGVYDFKLTTTTSTDFNQIALPLALSGITTAQDLMVKIPGCNSIARWDTPSQAYQQYIVNLNFSIQIGNPYFINCTIDTVFTLTGKVSNPSFQLITTNTTDFNEVMLPLEKVNISLASELLSDIPNCTSVAQWDAVQQAYIQYVPGDLVNDFIVRVGRPYYVNVTDNTSWPQGATPAVEEEKISIGIQKNQAKHTLQSKINQTPHAVWGKIITETDNSAPDNLSFNASLYHNPGEILTESSPGCHLKNGFWMVQCASFPSAWKEGDTLKIVFEDRETTFYSEQSVILSYDAADYAGIHSMLTDATLPSLCTLFPNYPNPFNPSTTTPYQLSNRSHVHLSVFNLKGEKIRVLVHEEKEAGYYEPIWDGTDFTGNRVSSGIYIILFRCGEFTQEQKILLLK